jgi:tRNA 2-selenouridine synthase
MHLPTYSVSEVLASNARIIDLRSPAEHARDHVPGAVNLPLLDDDQRAVVGTLYARESPQRAFEEGLSIVEQKMDRLLERILGREISAEQWRGHFRDLAEKLSSLQPELVECKLPRQSDVGGSIPVGAQAPLVLHCWRGGMRSQSVALLLRTLGQQHVGILQGGYKEYRRWVMRQLGQLSVEQFSLLVLRGPTGVGKTEILRQLEQRQANSTLDLEGLAQHRSSVLGAVGLTPVSQPRFESLLLFRLKELGSLSQVSGDAASSDLPAPRPPIFIEGESRKVGDVEIPGCLYQAMSDAPQIHLIASLEYRMELLGREYLATESHKQQTLQSLQALNKRLGKSVVAEMCQQIQSGDWRLAVATLLERHYDPLYRRDEINRNWIAEFDVGQTPNLLELLPALANGGAHCG